MKQSKVRDRRKRRSGSELLEALGELRTAIGKHASKVPPELRPAIQRVWEELDVLHRARKENSETAHGLETAHGRDAAGAHLARKQVGRHDAKKPPSGYTYDYGLLFSPTVIIGPPSKRAEYIARSLLLSLACLFNITLPDGRRGQLFAPVRHYLQHATPGGVGMLKLEKELPAMWEAYTGKPWGYPSWADDLVAQLEMNARHVEQRRLRELHGDPERDGLRWIAPERRAEYAEYSSPEHSGALFSPADGRQILKHIARHQTSLPAELTPDVVDAMIERVGLGAGGRRGKREARSVVNDFVATLGPQAKKRRRSRR